MPKEYAADDATLRTVQSLMYSALSTASGNRMYERDLRDAVQRQVQGWAVTDDIWSHARDDSITRGDIAWFDPGKNTLLCLPHRQNQQWRKQHG